MLSHPAILALVLALGAVFIVGVWRAWRDRRVDFIHYLDPGPHTDAVAALTFDRILSTALTLARS